MSKSKYQTLEQSEALQENIRTGYSMFEMAMTAIMLQAGQETESICSALVAGLTLNIASQSALAKVITPADVDNPTQDHILMAGILTALCAPDGTTKTGVALTYSVETLIEGLNMFERATGRNPDKLFLDALVRAARDTERDSKALTDCRLAMAMDKASQQSKGAARH